MSNLKNKVVLVTGSGQGLGAEISKTLSNEGAIIAAADVRINGIEKVVNKIKENGGQASAYIMDVCNEKIVHEVIEKIVSDYGRLDIVINNAGVDYTKPIDELSFEEWNKVIKVNLCGPFNVAKIAYPYLSKSGSGHIVNIVSTAAKRAWANASAYHASKWGLLGFSHALHVEARQNNIKVTALIAGGMQTPFILERFPDVDPNLLQDPKNVADTIKYILCQPAETVIPEVMVIPMKETSWP
ncbi:MAG: SDR family oxidoreductase [Cytophagaceae bacterium]